MDDGYSQLGIAWQRIDALELALRRIAATNPDGSPVRSHESCVEIARAALGDNKETA